MLKNTLLLTLSTLFFFICTHFSSRQSSHPSIQDTLIELQVRFLASEYWNWKKLPWGVHNCFRDKWTCCSLKMDCTEWLGNAEEKHNLERLNCRHKNLHLIVQICMLGTQDKFFKTAFVQFYTLKRAFYSVFQGKNFCGLQIWEGGDGIARTLKATTSCGIWK